MDWQIGLQRFARSITTEYRKKHSDPWIVAYSGGKDSTLLLQLVWGNASVVGSRGTATRGPRHC